MAIREKLTGKLIEMAASVAIKEIQSNPKKGIHNLADKLCELAGEKLRPEYSEAVCAMLENPESPYFELIERVAKQTDQKLLIGFGLNLGYNGLFRGGKILRETIERYQIDLPWIVGLTYGSLSKMSVSKISEVISEGKQLGIFSYALFHTGGDVCAILSAVNKHKDCAFILFAQGEAVDTTAIKCLARSPGIMLVLNSEMPSYKAACLRLKEARMLYSVGLSYGEHNITDIISDKWVDGIVEAGPILSILVPRADTNEKICKDAQAYVGKRRTEPRQPTLLVELPSDSSLINRMVSACYCSVLFDGEGQLRDRNGDFKEGRFNLRDSSLRAILINAFPKKRNKI